MATEQKYAGAKAPRKQMGVSRQLPEGYNGPFTGWVGKVSDAAGYGTVFAKLPKGFKATKYIFAVEPLADEAYPQHTVASGSGDNVTISLRPNGTATVGSAVTVYAETTNGSGTGTGATGGVAIGSSQSPLTLNPAASPPVTVLAGAANATAGNLVRVANDDSWVMFTVGASSLVGDGWLKLLVYLEQIDPEPEARV